MTKNKGEPPPVIDAWLAIDGDVFNVAQGDAAFAKAVVDRLCRQARPVLDPAKAFLLCRSNNFSILYQARRRISLRIETKNDHCGRILSLSIHPAGAEGRKLRAILKDHDSHAAGDAQAWQQHLRLRNDPP